MPFVNIRILEGHSQERKREMVKRITEDVAEIAQIPESAVWVVIEDVKKSDWSVGGKMLDDSK